MFRFILDTQYTTLDVHSKIRDGRSVQEFTGF